jgi:hypothetical protein
LHVLELDEDTVLRLPYAGPISRRIYVFDSDGANRELFVQRNDAFTTNLVGLLRSLKSGEISEITYSVGFDGLVRIFRNEKGMLIGEYNCLSEKSLEAFKQKLGVK